MNLVHATKLEIDSQSVLSLVVCSYTKPKEMFPTKWKDSEVESVLQSDKKAGPPAGTEGVPLLSLVLDTAIFLLIIPSLAILITLFTSYFHTISLNKFMELGQCATLTDHHMISPLLDSLTSSLNLHITR
jgi:hypothetical protein